MKGRKSVPEWLAASNDILRVVGEASPNDQLRVFQQQLRLLPAEISPMVEHFVSLAVVFKSNEMGSQMAAKKHFHLSLISCFTFVFALILVGGGIYIVMIAGPSAASKINILGATVETSSVGVACFGLAAIMFIFTIRSVVAKM
ncbi:hypothetical protein LAV84_05515 [Rhizobium sp. VS19-DR104.2]|uniref:hypothetical protein n=1 Tax=unclassified Rhizobium TaxID=2613769 RepID=UPI001C5AF0D8|nr:MULTISPECIES: hypothetical protein [unclassified Rhizobium]MBZ5759684.1 hypothetical protein [Rhizobium sp. VS19-DR96]MBZ5766072.1 hypothetical protein [Rhizobium sp. VS19-DR129.2]MBZ5772855.1 hypothetical protein [Rhizobium sp. VS19-DRK62.2]MBZ5786595.1 hypothetical protein [Rhizobium sp. VS19-DR121]MBZ5804381.1 hypothetical protein [Rhizobium sp. VS19-DR181]